MHNDLVRFYPNIPTKVKYPFMFIIEHTWMIPEQRAKAVVAERCRFGCSVCALPTKRTNIEDLH